MGNSKRVFTVLVIDGGGVRGIVPARILETIEARTGKPIAELFDMVGGISTGAIVAAGLTVPDENNPGKPKYTAENIKDFYFKQAPKIFPELRFKSLRQISSSAAYDPRPLEDTLLTYFGDNKISDSLVSLMIPATDIKNFRPAWMTSIKGQPDHSDEGWSTMLMRDAIRGATTAPTYFPAKYVTTTPNPDVPGVQHRHTLIDGGFFSGNAMRRMLTQARKVAPPDAEIVVVHVGTGMIGNSLSPEEWNKLGPLGMLSKKKGSVLMSLAINIGILDMAQDLRDELGDRFISLNGNIDFEDTINHPSTEMDDASLSNMQLLENFADRIIKDNGDDVDRLCHMLAERLMAEQNHTQSAVALAKLTERMEKIHTVKSLNRFYRLVLHTASGLANGGQPLTPRNAEQAELFALAGQLTEAHRADLYRIYNALQDKLQNQSQIMNSVKEAGDNMDRFLKKISGKFNGAANDDKPSEPPANDDIKPPSAGLERSPAAKKAPWWKRQR